MAQRVFGQIEKISIGTLWSTRIEVAKSGVHKPTMNGISGTEKEGADSIVVSGGYEDDEDFGNEIIYTGTGGYDVASGKQIADQSFENTNNAALIKSQLEGLPVRVVRWMHDWMWHLRMLLLLMRIVLKIGFVQWDGSSLRS